eukprot:TRINITY_DN98279_c0_g1_i1.p1 TRINITY_DN98279_c0_g1~~TRINITY_DN98279_c0_g1_i1.p1  ORF type:complete len:223 (+),score=47.08 TRINITY_DN98279_c0_g1_i1:169-837(+)
MSRFQKRSSLCRVALVTLLGVVGSRFCIRSLGFATIATAPALQDRQRQNNAPVTTEEKKPRKTEEEEFKDRLKVSNNTLEFAFGVPDIIVPGVTHGSPYVTCFVEYQDRGNRDEYGTVQATDVLEEWVMRGDDQTVGRFTSWRQAKTDSSMRCIQTASKALEETTCIECIAPAHSMAASGQVPGAIVGTVHSSSVMTFSGLRHCLVKSGGYCKAGKVSVPSL